MHDIDNNKAPANMLNLFQKTSYINSYNTRSSTSGKFYVKSSRLRMQNNSFSRLGVKLWNKIPPYITDLAKKLLKDFSANCGANYSSFVFLYKE